MKLKEFINQIDGKLLTGSEETEFGNICRDSRIIKKGETYIALKGENFDANDFAAEAIKNGAKLCIISEEKNDVTEEAKKEGVTLVLVKDTLEALQEIAKYKRSLYNIPVVAVTGSVGKTSTKDIIASCLSAKYNVLKTQGNMNNFLGVPLTILNLKDEDLMVVEMGMNHFGELSKLTNIVKPTISVITNIGTAHIGNLGSRENILKAKLEILEGMQEKVLVINNDNDLLHEYYLKNKDNKEIKIFTYGIENQSDIMAKDIVLNEDNSEFICEVSEEFIKEKQQDYFASNNGTNDFNNSANNGSSTNNKIKSSCNEIENINNQENIFKIEVPVGGIHFVYNAICSVLVGKLLNLSDAEIVRGIKSFKPTKNRMDITKLKNGVTIINDSYNASLDSMAMLLKYLQSYNAKRKIAVLGDMLELGEYSEELHRKVGAEVQKNNIDILITQGENSKFIADEAIKNGMQKEKVFSFNTRDEIFNFIKENWKEGDCILFKASNGMKFFEIADKLIKENR